MSIIRDEVGQCSLTSAVEETRTEQSLEITPNPADNNIRISSASTIREVEIYNSLGQSIMTMEPHGNVLGINVDSFNQGLYILRIELENGKTFHEKVIRR